jgi:hypothetical protein
MPTETKVRCVITKDDHGFDLTLWFNVLLQQLGTDVTIYRNQWEAELRKHKGYAGATASFLLEKDHECRVSDLACGLVSALLARHTGVTMMKITPYAIYLKKSKAVDDQTITDCVNKVGARLGLC